MSDVQIHPTAIIDPGAELGPETIVGPYCVIGPDVALGSNCWLQHHVTLCGPMKAGAKNRFYAYCSIGQQTQDLKYRGEPTYLEIGDENTFREFVTAHRSTTPEGKNFPPESVKLIKEAFRLIYRSKYNRRQAIEAMQKELPPTEEITEIIQFIEQSERGIIR